jgi:hypothetical protein
MRIWKIDDKKAKAAARHRNHQHVLSAGLVLSRADNALLRAHRL